MSASERRHPPSPSFAALGLATDPALVLILGATLVGFALRAAAAAGDLGLDEVWSLRLVGRVPSFGGVFWGISHDNNHFLNSAWLYLLGQDAPVWAYRLPALVMGTLTVPALARLCGRANPAAGPFAAAFGAVALPLVDFGSEARGYAGLVLATVLAVEAAGRAVDATLGEDHAACRRAAWRLGAAIGIGLASHLTMADAAAVLGVATLIRLEAHRNRRHALLAAFRIFLPSVLLALPVAAFILAGIAVRGTFTIGDTDPFTLGKLVAGFGGMALLAMGLPDALPAWLGGAGAMALLLVAARHRLASPWALAVGVAALVALPLAVAALRLPNVVYARYFSVCAVALLVLAAEMLGTLWSRGDEHKRAALLAALAMVAGGLVLDASAIRDGRSNATETLALMRAEGTATYAADHPFMAAMLLDDAARRGGGGGVPAAEADACPPPDWFIAVGVVDRRPDGTAAFGPPACRASYGPRRPYDASPLSGTAWTLYRKK